MVNKCICGCNPQPGKLNINSKLNQEFLNNQLNKKPASCETSNTSAMLPDNFILKQLKETNERIDEFSLFCSSLADSIKKSRKLIATDNTNIPSKGDLNTSSYMHVGVFTGNNDSDSITNCPSKTMFRMEVFDVFGDGTRNPETQNWTYRVRKIIDLSGNQWVQQSNSRHDAGVFYYSDWLKIASTKDIENAIASKVPTKVSELENDSGFLTEHQDISGKADKTELFSKDYNDLTNKPTIPTKVSQLENDSKYSTENYVDTKVAGLVNSAPETLDTLGELAEAFETNEDMIKVLEDAIVLKADDKEVVHLSGEETITGKKIFDGGLSVSNTTIDEVGVKTDYVKTSSLVTDCVFSQGDSWLIGADDKQVVIGDHDGTLRKVELRGYDKPVWNNEDEVFELALDQEVVHNTGNQIISNGGLAVVDYVKVGPMDEIEIIGGQDAYIAINGTQVALISDLENIDASDKFDKSGGHISGNVSIGGYLGIDTNPITGADNHTIIKDNSYSEAFGASPLEIGDIESSVVMLRGPNQPNWQTQSLDGSQILTKKIIVEDDLEDYVPKTGDKTIYGYTQFFNGIGVMGELNADSINLVDGVIYHEGIYELTLPSKSGTIALADDNASLYGGTIIANGSDLQNVNLLQVGNYVCKSDADAKSLTNAPTGITKAFLMKVYSPTAENSDASTAQYIYRIRKIITRTGDEYIQTLHSTSWKENLKFTDWVKITTEADNMVLNANIQNIEEKISIIENDITDVNTDITDLESRTSILEAMSGVEKSVIINVECEHSLEYTGYGVGDCNVAIDDKLQVIIPKIKGNTRTKSPNLVDPLEAFTVAGFTHVGNNIYNIDNPQLVSGNVIWYNQTGKTGSLKFLYSVKTASGNAGAALIVRYTDGTTSNAFPSSGLTDFVTYSFISDSRKTVANAYFAWASVTPTYIKDFAIYEDLNINGYIPFSKELVNSKNNLFSTGTQLWDEKYEYGGFDDTNGTPDDTFPSMRTTNFTRVLPNTTYYINNIGKLYFYDIDKNFISTGAFGVFTTPSNCYYLKFRMSTDYGHIYHQDIMLNYGSTPLDYQPYKVSSLYCNEELGEFDYIDLDEKRLIKQTSNVIVLKGTEDWVMHTGTYNNVVRFDLDMNMSDYSREVNNRGIGVCNICVWTQASTFAELPSGFYICPNSGGTKLYILVPKNSPYTTLENFKLWMAFNNIHFVYKSAIITAKEANISGNNIAIYKGGMQLQDGSVPYRIVKSYPVGISSQFSMNIEADRNQQQSINELKSKIQSLESLIVGMTMNYEI